MVKAAKGAAATKVAAASNINNLAEIKDTHTSELVIALCGPIGSPIHDVAKAFKECLEKSFGYDYAHILKLSSADRKTWRIGPVRERIPTCQTPDRQRRRTPGKIRRWRAGRARG
jgi:hypothetical protein